MSSSSSGARHMASRGESITVPSRPSDDTNGALTPGSSGLDAFLTRRWRCSRTAVGGSARNRDSRRSCVSHCNEQGVRERCQGGASARGDAVKDVSTAGRARGRRTDTATVLAPRPAAPGAPVPASLGIALGLPAGAVAALMAAVVPHGATVGVAFRLGAGAIAAGSSGGVAGSGALLGIVLVALVAGVLGAVTEPLPALGAAAQVWACWDGFVRHGLGMLAFGPGDLTVLGVVAAAALATAGVAALHRQRGVGVRGYAAGQLPAFLAGPVAD